MEKLSASAVEGKSQAGSGGGDEGRGGGIRSGEEPEIRRRLRGGGLTSGDGMVCLLKDEAGKLSREFYAKGNAISGRGRDAGG